MLSNLILAFWYTLRSLLANMNFTETSCSPHKPRGQFPSHQNLLFQAPCHLPGGLSEQPLPEPEAALQAAFLPSTLLFVFKTWPGVCVPSSSSTANTSAGHDGPSAHKPSALLYPSYSSTSTDGMNRNIAMPTPAQDPTSDPQQLQVTTANPASRIQALDDPMYNEVRHLLNSQ